MRPTVTGCTGRPSAARTAPPPTTTALPRSSAPADGTRVTIVGRQQFTLPLFWQVFDLDLRARSEVDAGDARLSDLLRPDHRELRGAGRRSRHPHRPTGGRSRRRRRWNSLCRCCSGSARSRLPLLQRIGTGRQTGRGRCRSLASTPMALSTCLAGHSDRCIRSEQWIAEITRFIDGFGQAAGRDLTSLTGA